MKHSDSGGLYLLQQPTGGKLWRMDYRHAGKRKTLALGAYPAVSLKDARARRDEAKKLLANGQDPGEVKKARKAAIHAAHDNSFEVVARAWFSIWKAGVAETTAKHKLAAFENDIFPQIGSVPVSEMTAPKVLQALRWIESHGAGNAVHVHDI